MYNRTPELRQHITTSKYDHENDLRYTEIKQMKEDIVYQSVQDVSSSPRDHLRPYYTLKKNVLIIIIIIPRKQIQIKYKNEVLSQATLIGTPARLLIHAIIHSANHVAAKSCRRMSRASVNVHREMVVGAKRAGLSIFFF